MIIQTICPGELEATAKRYFTVDSCTCFSLGDMAHAMIWRVFATGGQGECSASSTKYGSHCMKPDKNYQLYGILNALWSKSMARHGIFNIKAHSCMRINIPDETIK